MSAFAVRRSFCDTHATAALRISDRERKLRPSTTRRVAREALSELEHVARLRAPPGVDELIVVRHRADVSVRPDQERDQDALGLVRVLELIDHDPLPALAVARPAMRVLGQQSHRTDQQIVEAERVRAPQLLLRLAPHLSDQRRGRVARRPLVCRRREQPVLGQRDLREHLARGRLAVIIQGGLDRTALGVRQQPLDDVPHVGLVVDRVVLGATEERGVLAEHPRAYGVERGRRDGGRDLLAEQVRQPQPQLTGGADAERHREDLPRLRQPARQKPGDPVDQRAGLARAGARDDQQRARAMGDRVRLLGCQALGAAPPGAAAAVVRPLRVSSARGSCNMHLPSGGRRVRTCVRARARAGGSYLALQISLCYLGPGAASASRGAP